MNENIRIEILRKHHPNSYIVAVLSGRVNRISDVDSPLTWRANDGERGLSQNLFPSGDVPTVNSQEFHIWKYICIWSSCLGFTIREKRSPEAAVFEGTAGKLCLRYFYSFVRKCKGENFGGTNTVVMLFNMFHFYMWSVGIWNILWRSCGTELLLQCR